MAKSLLVKIFIITILIMLLAGFLYFTNASKIIGKEPVKNCPSVSRSISGIPEGSIAPLTGSPDTNEADKNETAGKYDFLFSEDISIGNPDNSSGNEQYPSDAQEQNTEDSIQVGSLQEDDSNSSGDTGSADDTSGENNYESFAAALLNLINTARQDNGCYGLNANGTINTVAQFRSQDMIDRGYFSHQTPEGKNINVILQEYGVMFAECAENIQFAFPPSHASPELFFNSWMNSDLHRANMLNGNFSQIGIGISNNNDRIIAVLVFIN